MYDFAYHKPSSLAEAAKLLADPDAKAVSGGHTLIPALKHRLNKPSALVDLSGIAEMKGIRREGNAIIIGALTRHVEVANSAEVKAAIPALEEIIADPSKAGCNKDHPDYVRFISISEESIIKIRADLKK
jgi:carbon-monoxide dehydrogenase medium subunit